MRHSVERSSRSYCGSSTEAVGKQTTGLAGCLARLGPTREPCRGLRAAQGIASN